MLGGVAHQDFSLAEIIPRLSPNFISVFGVCGSPTTATPRPDRWVRKMGGGPPMREETECS